MSVELNRNRIPSLLRSKNVNASNAVSKQPIHSGHPNSTYIYRFNPHSESTERHSVAIGDTING